ncbi:MAG: biopolymer transporter ExbD [Spirochaetota bacterium]
MFRKKKKNAPTIPVSSMADIAFLLIVFFMVTSVLDTDPDVPIELPNVPGGEQLNKKIANIYLSAEEGRPIFFNSMRVSLEEAINRVRAKMATIPDFKVLIHADKELPYAEIDNVFEKLKLAGALKISLITQTSQGGGL